MTDATRPPRDAEGRALVGILTVLEQWPSDSRQRMVQFLVTRFGLPALGPIDVASLRDLAEEMRATGEAMADDTATGRRERDRDRQRRHRLSRVTGRDRHVTNDVTGVTDSPTPPGVSASAAVAELQNGSNGKALRDKSTSLQGFEAFWTIYPRKIGKGAALKSWRKQLLEHKSDAIVRAITSQMPHLRSLETKYVPHPATWLNEQRWDDEPPAPSLFTPKTSGNAAAAGAFIERMNAEKAEREASRGPR